MSIRGISWFRTVGNKYYWHPSMNQWRGGCRPPRTKNRIFLVAVGLQPTALQAFSLRVANPQGLDGNPQGLDLRGAVRVAPRREPYKSREGLSSGHRGSDQGASPASREEITGGCRLGQSRRNTSAEGVFSLKSELFGTEERKFGAGLLSLWKIQRDGPNNK